jgi:1-acyl-sn-glycerol-3-phosphate acyltransferase
MMTDDSAPVSRTRLQRLGTLGLKRFGWRIVGELPRDPKFVIIAAPHTSNWDFFPAMGARFALGLKLHFLGKHTLFRGPLGTFLRAIGGRPVRRDSPEGLVADVAAEIRESPAFVLGLAPEGTRKRVTQWRTGFYRIAEAADVPIVPVWLDWKRREVGIGEPLRPTGDLQADLARLQANYRREMARHPDDFWD